MTDDFQRDPDESEYLADPEEDNGQDTLPIQEDKPKRPRRATAEEKAAAATPIAQVGTDDTAYGKVHITRSLSLGSRNDTVHLGVELPVPIQPGWSLAQQAVAAADVCGIVKSIVYSQLGLDYTVDEDGVIHEVVKAFPGTERVREERAARGDDREEELGSYGRRQRRDDDDDRDNGRGRDFAHPGDLTRPSHVDAEVWDDLVHNYGDWFDNRRDKASGKYKGNAPDFKRAEDAETVWLKPFRQESGSRGGSRGYDRRR